MDSDTKDLGVIMNWVKVDEGAFYIDDQDVDLYQDLQDGGWILDLCGKNYKFITKQRGMRAYDDFVRTGIIEED